MGLFDATETFRSGTAGSGSLDSILSATRRRHHLRKALLKKYRNEDTVLAALARDPYDTVIELDGGGWGSADAIAKAMGIPSDHPGRLKHAVVEVMRQQETWGHCWHAPIGLRDDVAKLAGISRPIGQKAIQIAADEDAIHVASPDHLYFPKLHLAETKVVESIGKLRAVHRSHLRGEFTRRVNPADPSTWMGLQADQAEAFAVAAENSISIITGPPGSGKTHMLRAILDAFNGTVSLCAPTGRAAKRMQESTGRDASTIHRLLIPQRANDGWRFALDEVPSDLLVVDEASMLSLSLAAALFARVKNGTRVILVGDPNQLPAVGPGDVLRDLIKSGAVRVGELSSIKRQDAGMIIRACHEVLAGRVPDMPGPGESDLAFIEQRVDDRISSTARSLLDNRSMREKYGAANEITGIQVITPRRKKGSPISCEDFNGTIWRANHPHFAHEPFIWPEVGDKVMQIKNDYNLGVMNGDVGVVVDRSGDNLTVDVDGEKITTTSSTWKLDHAWATTIHKGQGSEWPVTILMMHESAGGMLLTRQLFYTALSRARNLCVIVGSGASIRQAIRNDREERRRTMLAERLRVMGSK